MAGKHRFRKHFALSSLHSKLGPVLNPRVYKHTAVGQHQDHHRDHVHVKKSTPILGERDFPNSCKMNKMRRER